MFKNSFQGGSHVDVLVASGKDSLAKHKLTHVEREYNREVKGYIYSVAGSTTLARFQYPLREWKVSTLCLLQRFVAVFTKKGNILLLENY